MPKPVNLGDKELVKVSLKFEGTIHNHLVLIEDQYINTGGSNTDRTGEKSISFDGDPIKVLLMFKGEVGSKIKEYKITINNYTYTSPDEIKLKVKEIRVEIHIPYSYFDLLQINVNAPIA